MKISYECSELIEELKQDIEEFGDEFVQVLYDEENDLYLDYNPNIDYNELDEDEKEEIKDTELVACENRKLIFMKSSDLLKKLIEQNEIL